MRLRALDQITVSAAKADKLKPGEEFEVSDDLGAELLKRLPKSVAFVEVKEKAPRKSAATPAPKTEGPAPGGVSVIITDRRAAAAPTKTEAPPAKKPAGSKRSAQAKK